MKSSKQFSIGVFVLAFLVPLATAQGYVVTDLGTFEGGSVSQGNAVNVSGRVAGYARFANYNAHGFIWAPDTGLVDLGALPPETNFSVAQAINSLGEVVGYSDYNDLGQENAVLWSKGKLHNLGTLPGGNYSQANGINDSGQIGGFSNDGSNKFQAVIWSKGGGVQSLGTLPGGYYSQGIAINSEGQVAGYSNAGDGQWHGFLWTKTGGMEGLPNVPGGTSASANGIDDVGEVVGGSGNNAVLWHNDKEHTVENLGALGGWSTAFAINDVGQVVGWSSSGAFVWTREKGMQTLNSLIPPNSGWTLVMATGINVRGQITGEGNINGQQHGFLLTPVSE